MRTAENQRVNGTQAVVAKREIKQARLIIKKTRWKSSETVVT